MTPSNAVPLVVEDHRCDERNCLLATVVLVDSRGWLLLQERDEHALVSPNQWGLVGGHLEDGEDWETARRRELEEETGLRIDTGLTLWFDEIVQHSPKASSHLADHWRIWAGKVDLTDGDMDLSVGAAHVLPLFLESETYRAML